ncbi:MAG: acyl-CoA dehydrogenase [Byssovorax sp.]
MLLDPKRHVRPYPDERSRAIMQSTIAFFEAKGKQRLRADDLARTWYDDFLTFVKQERIFATLLTPSSEADASNAAEAAFRWDTWRNCEFNEILGFYGLCYWYTWQVSILGLGPLWMSPNAAVRARAKAALADGGIFGFGLSEKHHGADIYSTDMILTPQPDGGYLASGEKYYIGNGNKAAILSTFGKIAGTEEYVFFAVDTQHPKYRLVKNVVASQSYVSEYALSEYPVTEADVLSRGKEAWNAALNTVNIGKYNLGWASIGMCTHALYEAINHAANRRLYNMYVTDFPHVKQMFTEAYARLVAMKLFALRAADYLRGASADDRRYLLYNPVMKMKVTTQGEEVIDLLWDVIAAKGFEKDTFFDAAARDIRALPKLEGTVHVNIALIVKFMPNYFFAPADYPTMPRMDQAKNDDFLFAQGATSGLGKIRFHDYAPAFDAYRLPNVSLFQEQIAVLKELLATATPDEAQRKDLDFLMTLGEMFTLVVYAQLVAENAKIYGVEDDLVDQMFDCFVRDFAGFAQRLHAKPSSTEAQMACCIRLIRKPVFDERRYQHIWQDHVHALNGVYEMSP